MAIFYVFSLSNVQATGDPADLARAEQIYDEYASQLDYAGAWINWDDKTPAFVVGDNF